MPPQRGENQSEVKVGLRAPGCELGCLRRDLNRGFGVTASCIELRELEPHTDGAGLDLDRTTVRFRSGGRRAGPLEHPSQRFVRCGGVSVETNGVAGGFFGVSKPPQAAQRLGVVDPARHEIGVLPKNATQFGYATRTFEQSCVEIPRLHGALLARPNAILANQTLRVSGLQHERLVALVRRDVVRVVGENRA